MAAPDVAGCSELQASALSELERPIECKRPSGFYRLSLGLVTLVVVALPLVYLAIVTGTAWGVVWYVLHVDALLAGVHDIKADLALRCGPVVIGTVLFFFLLKPLLARSIRGARPRELVPEHEPFLFEFVQRLARTLDAPVPKRIRVDLKVNASASFVSGWISFFRGDLALTLGLPLVSTMTLRQLTAVVAHEFGHFSQSSGMRFYYLTAAVNHWFARVALVRDRWDVWLANGLKFAIWLQMLVVALAMFFVWLSRCLLLVLMRIGARASTMLSREMEFDADQNAIRLCGTEAFVSSMELLPLVEMAAHWAGLVGGQELQQGRLSDDYPALVCQGLSKMDGDARRSILEQSMGSAVKMYASHPPAGDRIARARSLNLKGAFTLDAPAAILFSDYTGLCKQLTVLAYQSQLGDAFDPTRLVSTASAVASSETRKRAAKRAFEYCHGVKLGPLSLGLESLELDPPTEASRVLEELGRARREAAEQVESARQRQKRGFEIEDKLRIAVSAWELLARCLTIRDRSMSAFGSEDVAMEEIARLREASASLQRERDDFARAMKERVLVSLSLLRHFPGHVGLEESTTLLERGEKALRCMADMRPLNIDFCRMNATMGAQRKDTHASTEGIGRTARRPTATRPGVAG